jgi:hypothetical protein
MAAFRLIDPHGRTIAAKHFPSAEDAHRWFAASVAANSEPGWRLEVDDGGRWAFFDDTGGFTAPASRPPPRH